MILTVTITRSHAESDIAALKLSRSSVAPGFTLPSTTGQKGQLSAQRGRIVLVHFFATWCEPCRDELPALQRLLARAEPNSMTVLAIAVADVDLRVQRLLQEIPVNFLVLLDRDRAVAKAWAISTLPSTVVLDSDHRARLAAESDVAWDRIEPAALIGRIKSTQGSAFAKHPREQRP